MKALLLGAIFISSASFLFAQEDSNVSLTIRFAAGNSRFHVGEIIPLEISFRATVPSEYDIEMRNYDRSGRLNMEQFHVTPPGRDPLARYFSDGAWMMGGLGGPRELTNDPQMVHEELNEWVALDKPGHYAVYVTSRRVSRRASGESVPIEVKSNTLEFEVVAADEAWQRQTLSSAITTLKMESSTREEKTAALRALRFLDSPQSVKELVRMLGTDSGSAANSVLGLAGSRNQSLLVRELEEQMNAPEIGLTGTYLYTLAKLKFQQENGPLPTYPKTDKEEQKTWMAQRQARDKKLAELQDGLYYQAAALVRSKQAAARAETVQTILLRPSRDGSSIVLPAALSGEEIAWAFANLLPEEQFNLLQTFWNRLKVPEMAVPLKKLAQQPEIKNQMLRDLALRHLYELDPKEATPVFLEEMRHPNVENGRNTITIATLGLLPNETLPEFDQILADRLEQKESGTKGLDAQLLGRYATKAVLPRIKNIFGNAQVRWDCVAEDGFFVYLLRVDPDYGVKLLSQVEGNCTLMQSRANAAKMGRWSEIEPTLITRLNGSDLWNARNAAEALAQYGSPEAEEAMWKRLREFHAQWSERGDELTIRPGMRFDANQATGFQFGLVEALGGAQAWLLADEQITELENLTLGSEKANVKHWHWSSPVVLTVNLTGPQMIINFTGRYFATDVESMRNKVAQYPAGTRFEVRNLGSSEDAAPVLRAINEVAAEHGLYVIQERPTH
jgi:hypothetical protein